MEKDCSCSSNVNVTFRLANIKNILHYCNPYLVIFLLKRTQYLISLYNGTKGTCPYWTYNINLLDIKFSYDIDVPYVK